MALVLARDPLNRDHHHFQGCKGSRSDLNSGHFKSPRNSRNAEAKSPPAAVIENLSKQMTGAFKPFRPFALYPLGIHVLITFIKSISFFLIMHYPIVDKPPFKKKMKIPVVFPAALINLHAMRGPGNCK